MAKLKVAIVGCGRIAEVYRKAFQKCQDLVEVRFAVDKRGERAETFMKDFGGGYSENLADLLHQDLDVVHICTPHFLHKDQVTQCLEAGFDVLTEKPMAINLADADSMIETARKQGRKLGVIFQNRYIEGVIEAKRVIESGALGKIVGAWSHLTWWRPPSYYECDWKGSWEKEGGGVLMDQAIHSIDLVQYLVGSPVQWIHGHIDNRILKSVAVEDVADAVIGFQNGCVYSLFACNYYTQNAPIQIEIMGERGKVNIKGFEVTIVIDEVAQKILPLSKPVGNNHSEPDYWGTHHSHQIREFYECVLHDRPVVVDGPEGRKALEMVLGVYRSSRENQKIFL